MFPIDGLLMGAEGRLNGIPEFARDQRLMAARPGASLPAKVAVIERVLEEPLQLTEADELPLLRGREAFVAQLLAQRFEGVAAGGIELISASDHRRFGRIGGNHLPVAFAGIAVAERRLVREATFLHLLGHAFLHLVREVVDVMLGEEHHHPEGELAGGVVGKVLLPEEGLCWELVDSQVVTQVTAEAIDLLADNGANRRIVASGLDHLRELASPRFLGGLHIDVLPDDAKAMALGIVTDSLQLAGNRVAFTLLLFGFDSRVSKSRNHSALCGLRFDLSL